VPTELTRPIGGIPPRCCNDPLNPRAHSASLLDGSAGLEPAPADVQPKITAPSAVAVLKANGEPSGTLCSDRNILAYWSSATPAQLPGCVPPGTPARGDPCSTAGRPMYQHVLAWVRLWTGECAPSLGPPPPTGSSPGPRPSPPALGSCYWITAVDATTGTYFGFLSSGGRMPGDTLP
jgi:hypothetical protein